MSSKSLMEATNISNNNKSTIPCPKACIGELLLFGFYVSLSPPIDCLKPIPSIHFDIWPHMLASTLYFTLYLLTHSSAHASPSLLCGPPSYLQQNQARSLGSRRWSSLPLPVVQAGEERSTSGIPRRDSATSVPLHSCQ